MRIAVGNDERVGLTDFVADELRRRGHEVEPFGPLAGEGPQVGGGGAVSGGAHGSGTL